MKMCDPHWIKLKAAMNERGLEKYIAKSGEEAMQGVMESKADPLMSAFFGIVHHAMEIVGLELMSPNEDGSDKCPLCFLQQLARTETCTCGDPTCTPENRVENIERWIEYAANAELQRFTGTASA